MKTHLQAEAFALEYMQSLWSICRIISISLVSLLVFYSFLLFRTGYEFVWISTGIILGMLVTLFLMIYPIWSSLMGRNFRNWWRAFPHPIVSIQSSDEETLKWLRQNVKGYYITNYQNDFFGVLIRYRNDAIQIKLMRQ